MRLCTELKRKHVLSVIAVACMIVGQATAACGQQAQDTGVSAKWIKDPVTLLKHLKRRDAEFDNRTLQVDQIWSDKVYPKAQLAAGQAAARRFGQKPSEQPPAESIPDDFEQSYRSRQLLTVRGLEVTLEKEAELEELKHPRYLPIKNIGHRWSNAGGDERSYSPETKSLHLMGRSTGGVLQSTQWMFEWCCGYGFAKRMESIDSVRVEGDRLFVKGKATLMGYDDSRIEMELDRDYIVRRADIIVPVQIGSGDNKYVVETHGTVKQEDGGKQEDSLSVAKSGTYKRYLRPSGKPERLYKEYEVAFVGLSEKLTDEQYAERTTIDPPDDVSVVDFRPLDQR